MRKQCCELRRLPGDRLQGQPACPTCVSMLVTSVFSSTSTLNHFLNLAGVATSSLSSPCSMQDSVGVTPPSLVGALGGCMAGRQAARTWDWTTECGSLHVRRSQ